MGFGRSLDYEPWIAMPGAIAGEWQGQIRLIADALGVEVAEVRERFHRRVTNRTLEVAMGTGRGSVLGPALRTWRGRRLRADRAAPRTGPDGRTHHVPGSTAAYPHTRGLLNKLITPKRLKENEDFMWRLADEQLDTFIDRGECEFLEEYAKPFSLLVIADLLGVPAEVHDEFREAFANKVVGALGHETPTHNPLQWLNDKFYSYIEDRRRQPRDDMLTELAQAKYEDGSTPEIVDVMNLSTFLFAAGTETTTKFRGSFPDGTHDDDRRRRQGSRRHDGHAAAGSM